MVIMTYAKFYFNRLMLTLIFGIRASEPPPPSPHLRPGERLKRPGLIGLTLRFLSLLVPTPYTKGGRPDLPAISNTVKITEIHGTSMSFRRILHSQSDLFKATLNRRSCIR